MRKLRPTPRLALKAVEGQTLFAMLAKPVDPAPFLSTITTASAALVAIVGGLLVARFVTLDSEQEGAQRVLDDAIARRDLASRREEEARQNRLGFEINLFFNFDAVKAVNAGTRDAIGLREIGDPASWLNDEQIERHARNNPSEIQLVAVLPINGSKDADARYGDLEAWGTT